MNAAVFSYFKEVIPALRAYRVVMNRVFSRKLATPRHCARYFFDVLRQSSRLYNDHLLFRDIEPTIAIHSVRHPRGQSERAFSIDREMRLRQRLKLRLEALPSWATFDPNNPFVDENQLRTPEDYIANLVLHLPEIYGEAATLEACARDTLQRRRASDAAVADFGVRIDHAAHHVSYCLHALELLSHENNWIRSTYR
jgi:hypothetical protein